MIWFQIAVVVRSNCHDRTWIGHVAEATFEDTPAGPLRIVKEACVAMVSQDFRRYDKLIEHRWHHSVDDDCWVLEIREPQA